MSSHPWFVVRLGVAYFPWSSDLGEGLSRGLSADPIPLEVKVFPDGEDYVRFPTDPRDYDDLVIIQRAFPEQDRRLLQLLLAIHAASDLGTKRIHVVLPYLPYSRQDRRFREGEAVSFGLILKLIRDSGARSVVSVDVHRPEAFVIEGARCINVEPFSEYGRILMGQNRAMVLSPDRGSLWRAKSLSQHINAPFDYFEKFRDRITGEISLRSKSLDIDVNRVIILDDIVATGSTIVEAIKALRDMDIKDIWVIATHCLLLNNADERIIKAGASLIICSNTINTPYSRIDVTGLMLTRLKEILP